MLLRSRISERRFSNLGLLATILVSSLCLGSCTSKTSSKSKGEGVQAAPNVGQDPAVATKSAPQMRAELETWRLKGRKVTGEFALRLKSELRKGISKGDFAHAVKICAKEAPKIALEFSKGSDMGVKRISQKARNPDNQARGEEVAALSNLDRLNRQDASASLEQVEDLGTGQIRYIRGIRTEALCTACHGANVSAPLREAIREIYPGDRATGYAVGELRGAFVVQWRLPVPSGLDAPSVRAPRVGLVTGGAPSSSDIQRLKNRGFAWVIDLRSESEVKGVERKEVVKAKMKYANIPIGGARDVNFENAQALAELLGKAGSSQVFLHCASGNRVGALIALLAFQEGSSVGASLERGRAAGLTSLEPHVEALLGAAKAKVPSR